MDDLVEAAIQSNDASEPGHNDHAIAATLGH